MIAQGFCTGIGGAVVWTNGTGIGACGSSEDHGPHTFPRQRYYVDAIGCAAIPGAPDPHATRRDAIRAALRAACHPGDVALIIRADSVESRGPNVHWRNGRVLRAIRGDSPLRGRLGRWSRARAELADIVARNPQLA